MGKTSTLQAIVASDSVTELGHFSARPLAMEKFKSHTEVGHSSVGHGTGHQDWIFPDVLLELIPATCYSASKAESDFKPSLVPGDPQ